MNIVSDTAKVSSSSAYRARVGLRLRVVLPLLIIVLFVAFLIGLGVGYQQISIAALKTDPITRAVFFRLRLPRVVMAGLIGASLSMVGAALQALFRNPLADPFTLGVSGGASLGASIAIAFGLGLNLVGVPFIFIAAFVGATVSVLFVYRLARSGGGTILPGALLLGVVLNLSASAGVLVIQYLASYGRALQILRWLIGSLDVVGFDLIWKMLVFLLPGWIVLIAHARDLHLLATGEEESAASLGVDVRRTERTVFLASSLIVAVTVTVGGAIEQRFVGDCAARGATVLGGCADVAARFVFTWAPRFFDTRRHSGRVAISPGELPWGAITALMGGPVFLLLRRGLNNGIRTM
jgi:iron complex transport system permease protein